MLQMEPALHVPLLVDYMPAVMALNVVVFKTAKSMMQVEPASHALQLAESISVVI